MRPGLSENALLLGFIVGLVFGLWNVVLTWLRPLEDDTPAVLLRFYGPMLLTWMLVAFRAARRSGSSRNMRRFSVVSPGRSGSTASR